MTKDEALRLALEALAYINQGANNQGPHTGISWRCAANKSAEALNTIKAALEAKDETLAYLPPTASSDNAFYIPPQRTWVGLTAEDLKLLSAEWRIVYGAWMDDFARDIEAKLKEKNT